MTFQTIPYHSYEKGLPQAGNFILGQADTQSIVVYQAFNHPIADYALAHQKFGGTAYSFGRMTWIKPNFLWMMYRSGWASKVNQERILAIKMSKAGFESLLEQGVYSSFQPDYYGTMENWKAALGKSEVRIQWDPDHNPDGEKLARRAIQIGMKGQSLEQFNEEFVQEIWDVSEFVHQQGDKIKNKEDVFFVANESIVALPEALKEKYAIPQTFIAPEITDLIADFELSNEISDLQFRQLLLEGAWRKQFVEYIRNCTHEGLSRYLLKKAIEYRKSGQELMCEDLLMFSYFTSKNGSPKDLDLIMEAKLADFDTWCGFDGEMIFYPLGYEATLAYLNEQEGQFSERTLAYFNTAFSKEYLYEDINSRALWYL